MRFSGSRTRSPRKPIRTTSVKKDADGLTEMQRDALASLGAKPSALWARAGECQVRRSVMQALVAKGHAIEAPADDPAKPFGEAGYRITDQGRSIVTGQGEAS